MNIRTVATGSFDVNALIVPLGHGTVVVVDPGEAAPVLRALDAAHETPGAVLLTHGHVDHLDGLAGLLERYPVPVFLHPDDAAWAFTGANRFPPFFPVAPPRPALLHPLSTQISPLPGDDWRCIHTPGHTPGSMCFLLDGGRALIGGDTLFREGVGRTDLPGGDPDALGRSLQRLMELPDETVVWPGHGPATTIGHERRHNPFIRGF